MNKRPFKESTFLNLMSSSQMSSLKNRLQENKKIEKPCHISTMKDLLESSTVPKIDCNASLRSLRAGGKKKPESEPAASSRDTGSSSFTLRRIREESVELPSNSGVSHRVPEIVRSSENIHPKDGGSVFAVPSARAPKSLKTQQQLDNIVEEIKLYANEASKLCSKEEMEMYFTVLSMFIMCQVEELSDENSVRSQESQELIMRLNNAVTSFVNGNMESESDGFSLAGYRGFGQDFDNMSSVSSSITTRNFRNESVFRRDCDSVLNGANSMHRWMPEDNYLRRPGIDSFNPPHNSSRFFSQNQTKTADKTHIGNPCRGTMNGSLMSRCELNATSWRNNPYRSMDINGGRALGGMAMRSNGMFAGPGLSRAESFDNVSMVSGCSNYPQPYQMMYPRNHHCLCIPQREMEMEERRWRERERGRGAALGATLPSETQLQASDKLSGIQPSFSHFSQSSLQPRVLLQKLLESNVNRTECAPVEDERLHYGSSMADGGVTPFDNFKIPQHNYRTTENIAPRQQMPPVRERTTVQSNTFSENIAPRQMPPVRERTIVQPNTSRPPPPRSRPCTSQKVEHSSTPEHGNLNRSAVVTVTRSGRAVRAPQNFWVEQSSRSTSKAAVSATQGRGMKRKRNKL